MKKKFKIGLGVFVLGGIALASVVLLGSVLLIHQVGSQNVVNENHTLETYAKVKMATILSLTNELLKDDRNLTTKQRQNLAKIADEAAQYIWELQTRVNSDVTPLEKIKGRY